MATDLSFIMNRVDAERARQISNSANGLNLRSVWKCLPREWEHEKRDAAISDYRGFLIVNGLYGLYTVYFEPTAYINEVWHIHILHTRQYDADCQRVFGEFFHHEMIPTGDACARERLSHAFIKEFGRSPGYRPSYLDDESGWGGPDRG